MPNISRMPSMADALTAGVELRLRGFFDAIEKRK